MDPFEALLAKLAANPDCRFARGSDLVAAYRQGTAPA
jgi:hypothetical protein